jgi:C4-dicarboxylate-specific signal transduction histidine kinase
VGNFVDITERKYIEEYQIEAEKLAERSLRLASLGTLAGGIAHEINQPLTVIKAEVDGIRIRKEMSQYITEEEVLDTMNVISEEVGRIHHIIEHMRSLIRGWPGGKMEHVDLNATIRHALEIVGQQVVNHSIGLSLDLPPNLPDVLGNAPYIEQIVINLVVNAMQALDTSTRPNKRIIVRTRHYGNQLVIAVLDNGPASPRSTSATSSIRSSPPSNTSRAWDWAGHCRELRQAMSGAIGAENIEAAARCSAWFCNPRRE